MYKPDNFHRPDVGGDYGNNADNPKQVVALLVVGVSLCYDELVCFVMQFCPSLRSP